MAEEMLTENRKHCVDFIWEIRLSVGNCLVEGELQGIGSVVPEPVQTIESPVIPVEEMHYNMAVIQNDPAAFTATFTSAEIESLLSHEIIHGIRKRSNLGCGTAGRDNHIIAENSQTGDIQGGNILGFTVVKQTGQTKYGFMIGHVLSSKSHIS